ncbi:alpha-L-fucosidase [Pedobacter ginsengiterrae]|uniref:alpha-L-fucosidase n=2 Tax=Pedobacter ginsengiterrae TaxID=871696 RepID=A0ABP7NNZ6_9SPHI
MLSGQFAIGQQNYTLIAKDEPLASVVAKAANTTPSAKQLRWQKLELTAFFHFGVNTFTDREWGTGKEDPKIFNPPALDADQWVRVAKENNFKQVIITAKHHDGFCLWPTQTTEHSVKNSPWKAGKGDVVAEVATACKKYGIGFGVYLSPWDMNAASYGTEAYNDFFLNQLTELLTKYGKVDEVWFDGANGEGPNGKKQSYDFNRWYTHIRKLQADAVIAVMGPDVRWVGTETGYGRETEWSVLPADNIDQNSISSNSQKEMNIKPSGFVKGQDIGSREKIKNAKGLVWYPSEADVSIRPGWFYHPKENDKVKSPEKLNDIYFSSVGRNSVLLLNIPPNTDGLLSDEDIKSLRSWTKLRSEIFKVNLANGAKITSANGKNSKAILDNRLETSWTTINRDTAATITLDLKGTKVFNVLSLQENISIGQRVEEFSLEYWDGKDWKIATQGTTIGYKRLLRFPVVSTNKVQLRISKSRLNPTISELGLFKEKL